MVLVLYYITDAAEEGGKFAIPGKINVKVRILGNFRETDQSF
jgi:hypothetical protein